MHKHEKYINDIKVSKVGKHDKYMDVEIIYKRDKYTNLTNIHINIF